MHVTSMSCYHKKKMYAGYMHAMYMYIHAFYLKLKKKNWHFGKYVTIFGKTNRLARKTNFFFIALLPFTSSEDATVQI